jgi:hypothetical protein
VYIKNYTCYWFLTADIVAGYLNRLVQLSPKGRKNKFSVVPQNQGCVPNHARCGWKILQNA